MVLESAIARQYTSYLVGVLITFYVFVFAPVSGFSINPARTTGSAVFANVWTAVWLYFVAPVLGMMTSAEIYLRIYGADNVLCAKLHPDPNIRAHSSVTFRSTVTRMRPNFQSKQISLNLSKKGLKRNLMPHPLAASAKGNLASHRIHMATQYDAIIIGTGAGGGTLALHLAQAGKKILILERGPFMPQEKLNWDTSAVFLDNRYHTKETWQDKDGKDLHPQQSYFVGGQTKVYGAAMFRMRAEDFGVIHHQGGISPAWPITYSDLEPYYTRAEELFHVHGDLGTAPCVPGGYGCSFDPTEPFHSKTISVSGLHQ